jgi:hypothetical protein
MERNTKKCPYCGEEILAVAKKCKHCGEWIEEEIQESRTVLQISDTEENYSQAYKHAGSMTWICYAAILVAVIGGLQDLDPDMLPHKYSFFIDLAIFIPESLTILAGAVLWIVLFWNLKNLFSKKLHGLFITLIVLEAFKELLAILDTSSVEENTSLVILVFFVLMLYLIIMFILGTKLSGSVSKTAFIVYSISAFVLLGALFMEEDDIPWWYTVLSYVLDIVLLFCIKTDFEKRTEIR